MLFYTISQFFFYDIENNHDALASYLKIIIFWGWGSMEREAVEARQQNCRERWLFWGLLRGLFGGAFGGLKGLGGGVWGGVVVFRASSYCVMQ